MSDYDVRINLQLGEKSPIGLTDISYDAFQAILHLHGAK